MLKIEKIQPEVKLDTKVNLEFVVKAEDELEVMSWDEAMRNFDSNPDSEHRLPTRLELLAMYDYENAIDPIGFESDGIYWSSSKSEGNQVWCQRFCDGKQSSDDKMLSRLVRLVRK